MMVIWSYTLNTSLVQKGKSIVQVINKVGSIPATGATAPIVEWLAHISDKDEMEVQFFLGVQNDCISVWKHCPPVNWVPQG